MVLMKKEREERNNYLFHLHTAEKVQTQLPAGMAWNWPGAAHSFSAFTEPWSFDFLFYFELVFSRNWSLRHQFIELWQYFDSSHLVTWFATSLTWRVASLIIWFILLNLYRTTLFWYGRKPIYQPPSGWERSILTPFFLFLSIFGESTWRIHGSVGSWFVISGYILGRCDEDNRASQKTGQKFREAKSKVYLL